MSAQIASVEKYLANGNTGPEIKGDTGGEDGTDMDHFAPVGDDSAPLAGDNALAIPLDGETENLVATAYADGTTKVASPGEKRIYARDSSGAVSAEVFLKNDGSIDIIGKAASVLIASNGDISISGTKVSLRVGEPLGSFLNTLHTAMNAWVVLPQDGGGALKTALTASGWLTQIPPGP